MIQTVVASVAVLAPLAADSPLSSTATIVLLILAAVVQLGLLVAALVDLLRRPDEAVAGGRRWVWILIVVLLQTIGPIIYFVAGRRPRPVADPARAGAAGTPAQTPSGSEARVGRAVDLLYGPAGEQPAEAAAGTGAPAGSDETAGPDEALPGRDDRA
ncbi:MAG: PLD nuclease N-terminal domain-containing protein [Thermoleophilia bacterium]|nr:PLD nuclease N-terminal domain-containing protein [Thermoleophilia bacterium]